MKWRILVTAILATLALTAMAPAQSAELTGVPAAILTMALAGSQVTRLLIDALRNYSRLDQWVPVLLAFILGPVCVFLLIVASGKNTQMLTQSDGATIILAGWIGAGMAIGSNSLAARAKPTRPASG